MFRRCFRALVPAIVIVAAACAKDPEIAKREFVASGDRYVQQGKYKEAVVQYRNAVQQDPLYGAARLKLADAYAKAGDPVNAAREYIRAGDLLPDDPGAQLKAAGVLLLAERYEEARARAKAVLGKNPRSVEAQILLGNATAQLKDLDGAVAQVEEAIRLDPARGLTYTNLGGLHLAKGNPEEAERAFRRAVEVAPASLDARLALANFYWSTARRAEAETELARVIELDAKNEPARRALAALYLSGGRTADAEKPLKELSEISQSPAARLALADYYLGTSRIADAEKILTPLAADKAAVDARVGLALVALRMDKPAEAHRRLDEALAASAKHVPALLLKADMLLAEGKHDEAVARIKTAIGADAKSAQAHFMLGKAWLALNRADEATQAFNETLALNPRAIQAQVALARLRLAEGDPRRSVELAQQAVAGDAQSDDAQLVLVQGLLAQRDIPRASAALQPLVARYPASAIVHTNVAMLAVLRGDRITARRALDRAEQLDPALLEPFRGQVQLDIAEKQLDSARARIEKRLARMPTDVPTLTVAAAAYVQMGDAETAELLLRKGLEADPSHLPAYALLGRLYFSQGRLDQARRELQAVVSRQPKPIAALTMTGIIDEMQKKPDEARRSYERAVELNPRAAVAANNLAWLQVQAGENLDVALQLAQAAKAQLPDSPEVNDTLGWIYYKKGLASLAVPALRQSVQKSPANPIFHYHLGLAYAHAGDKEKARRSLQEALALNLEPAAAADAARVLAQLKG